MVSGKKHRFYQLGLITVFFLAIFLRFYRINDRWSLDFDPARDTLVGREAITLHKIPPIGAFSSAGPFVWGPLYYWEIALSYLVAPNFAYAPWALYTLLDCVYVLVMMKIGSLIYQKKGAIIFGLLAAISPGQIFRSSLVNQPTLIPLFGALAILNAILYFKSKRLIHIFLMGASIGFALNNHFQALNFIPLILVLFFTKKKQVKNIVLGFILFFMGMLIPLLPLFYWDYFHQGFKNINNVLDFFLIGQYRFWVSNRWLTYAGQYWPNLWSYVIGGEAVFGYIFMLFMPLALIYYLITKKINKFTLFLAIVFIIQVFLNRYYRGVRYEGYMLYFYPTIVYFSGFVVINLFKLNKLLGFAFVALVFFFSLKADIKTIQNQMDPHEPRPIMENVVTQLKALRPIEKFRIYDYKYFNPTPSMVFSFLLNFNNLIDEEKGTRLGFSTTTMPYPAIATVSGIVQPTFIYDITSEWDKDNFQKDNWINVSPKYVALDIMEWWKVKKLNSTFCLPCFIGEKLGFR
jgi:hypothetical protein